MKKWILFSAMFLSVFTAAAYSEQALHEDALDSEAFVDEALFDPEFYLDEQGPLPLPDEPTPPGETPPPTPGAPQSFTLGSGQATRLGSRTYTFYPSLSKMISLRVIASKSNIEVRHVWVTYTDTMQTLEISQLRGELSRSRAKEVRMSGRGIFRVNIEVSSSSFWRQPGNFQMDGTSLR